MIHEVKRKDSRPFVPALGLRILNPLFDPLVRIHMRERAFKGRLVHQMKIPPGYRILDVGCGTVSGRARCAYTWAQRRHGPALPGATPSVVTA